ncbi:phage tail assembly chaperone [Vreelandella malpeensis]|uniref:Phage tail protein n=1 Tax=Vreelandella malpeensis TaxID=1172368 RepID=A0ABS8DUN2_9GAMM|nr:phage tail assembly chaperone [Halomonas malpeensis]MCB8889930.1 phage tail protein [Halomonas malpeensis]
MAGRKKPTAPDARQALLQPLAGYRHKTMDVPTSSAQVIVREPSGDDWLMWQARLQAVAGEEVSEENAEAVAERIECHDDHTPEAAMLVRVLIDPKTYDRLFSDDDVDLVAANWGPVYGRYLNAAFELAGITGAAPVADAKKN